METQELRKLLAGLGIASLLAGTTLMAGGCAKHAKSS
jgi:radical SAM modification target selenobiotic family peptide